MNENEVFFDTNIIVYAYDVSDEEKKSACKKLLSAVFGAQSIGVVSNQILAEVFYVLTTRIAKPLNAATAKAIILTFLKSDNWLKINYNEKTLEKAIETIVNIKLDLWDALIAETMKENGINKIITENEKDFRKIPGIKIINPFR